MKKQKQMNLSNRQYKILLGTLLRDGSLGILKNFANARFQMRHSITQTEWFVWKVKELKTLGSSNSTHLQDADGYSTKKKLHFQTLTQPCLTKLYHDLYTDGVRDSKKPWIDCFDDLSLMVWWLDDGSRIGEGGRKGRLNTQGFSYEENLILASDLKKKWDITCSVQKYKQGKREYCYLSFQTTEFKKCLRRIMPFIPVQSMVYKAFMRYKNQDCQESWISEMKEAMPKFVDVIDNLLLEKIEDEFDSSIE